VTEKETIWEIEDEAAAKGEADVAPATGTGGERWLCAFCHQPVAREGDLVNIHGSSEHTFTNPAGIKFRILLFAQVAGCLNVGTPTLQFTWFSGCAWSYCVCGQCRAHLGWFYTGLHDFVALIRERIVRASLVNN